MRKSLSLFGILTGFAFGLTLPGSEPVTVSLEQGRLHDAFKEVAAQANAGLWISPGVEDLPVTFSVEDVPVREVLSGLCERDRCRWKMVTSIVVWDRQEPTPEWSLSPQGTKPCQP